ncbi:hypothetical protein EVAR_43617_1 [Eumeta japonica]|uniref:Uncharacterized protein n=1 Tax=Eumeta variegata TaxID=151549 RepID=A0A4C1XHB3_EUMVA|nr:hypothetical protein EVAR_43617_1 [Eumeta japonica]
MEYSIYSSASGVSDDTLGENIVNEKYTVARRAEELTAQLEAVQQELHETRRGYQTALDIQRHLAAELETVQTEAIRVRADFENRLAITRGELDSLRAENIAAAEAHAVQVEALRAELSVAKKRERERDTNPSSPFVDRESPVRVDEESGTSTAIDEARAALENARAEAEEWRARAEELAADAEQLREVAEQRASEARAATEREAIALAELSLARATVASAIDADATSSHAVKGNSLFAEVEDKRQELARALLLSKQANAQLRREAAATRRELEALQRERRVADDSAHRHYVALAEVYEERITQLEVALERARRESPAPTADPPVRRLPALTSRLR